ncbi:hypothetical protein F5882DRAFT_292200, partial [Hyaloscypha sp. PMI_1271]
AAPFGKGDRIIVGEKVRKMWEFSLRDFDITNPVWKTFSDSIVAKLSAGLGADAIRDGVSAELYKMLLYDRGSMLKQHQDSEKAEGILATLVIVLPSKPEGGEVKLIHNGKMKKLGASKFLKPICHTSHGEPYLTTYIRFADITHEIMPVLSGCRLVLTYNLIQVNLASKELAVNSNNSMTKIRSTSSSFISGCISFLNRISDIR